MDGSTRLLVVFLLPAAAITKFLASAASSRNYYRLKLVDTDGRFIYSHIIILLGKQEQRSVQVYPNPATSFVIISSRYTIRQLAVIDAAGNTVLIIAGSRRNTETIPVQAFSPGIYLVQVITEAGTEQQKLMKK